MRDFTASLACAVAILSMPAFGQQAQVDGTGKGCKIVFGGDSFSGPAMTTAIAFQGEDWPVRWTSMGHNLATVDDVLRQHLATQKVSVPASQQEVLTAATQVGDDWLIGSANRHYLFWGNLYRVKPSGESMLLHGGNVLHMIAHGDARFVIVGSHAIRGTPPKVFVLKSSTEEWSLERLADLPEAPYAWSLTNEGVMLFATESGAFAVSSDGSVAEATAKESCEFWTPAGRAGGLPLSPGVGQQ